MHVGLIPLDERPVNTRDPVMIAAIAGVRLSLPPPRLLSMYRQAADCAALGSWLTETAPSLDALIVSCEMLGYGGLVASRISDEPAGTILARLDLLRTLKARHPQLQLLGFNLVTRVSNADHSGEEPAYWARYGTRLYQLSQLMDRQQQGEDVTHDMAHLVAAVPEPYRQDFLHRRARNHIVNLGALQLLAEGVFDLLVLSSDDTSPYGLPSREKRWLAEWGERLALGERLLMYPGADEVGCVLVARLLNMQAKRRPRFKPLYAPSEGALNIAPYEDGPVALTVQRQTYAVSGLVTEAESDFWLAVNAPVARHGEWDPELAEQERVERLPALQALVAEAVQQQQAGQPVIIVDVAYPNGADPTFLELLQAQINLPGLAAYGAWNTAGNTIGTALAQACASQFIANDVQQAAHERFLLHRLVEDWGYQRLVRAELREWLQQQTGSAEPTATNLRQVLARIEARLNQLIGELPGFAGRYHILPGSVRLPWGRMFEVDFELADGTGVDQ
ncbi:MAG: DUF4127 family protein [Herpetosiphonaceae bacterium]|nr:DUF4127 family protein [Herpetosiphonaceae bacterium]